jgi:hypothetical protein
VDGDVFGKVTKLGRAASDAVARALAGGTWDAFHASRCIDALIAAADGIPSLIVIDAELASLRTSPLFARLETENVLGRIRDASIGLGCTELDLILRSSVERSVLRGEFGLPAVLERFCGQLLERAILTGRGGFIEEHGPGALDDARAVLASTAVAAAAVLNVRPHAKRLGLARSHADVGPNTDLLGGP